jgi:hypothetical protein
MAVMKFYELERGRDVTKAVKLIRVQIMNLHKTDMEETGEHNGGG